MIRHFVALGDSFTEGVGDPDPRSSSANDIANPVGATGLSPLHPPQIGLPTLIPLRSAHDWIALWMQAANPNMQYTNLAERGLRAGEIRNQQMQPALNLEPDFVSIVAGANDCLRGPFNAHTLKAELNLMFGAFASLPAKLFTSTLPDFTQRLELPESIRGRIGRNLETTNAIIVQLAQRHGAILFDFRTSGLDSRAELWSEDGVHPNALGYLETAKAVVSLLKANCIELEVLP